MAAAVVVVMMGGRCVGGSPMVVVTLLLLGCVQDIPPATLSLLLCGRGGCGWSCHYSLGIRVVHTSSWCLCWGRCLVTFIISRTTTTTAATGIARR